MASALRPKPTDITHPMPNISLLTLDPRPPSMRRRQTTLLAIVYTRACNQTSTGSLMHLFPQTNRGNRVDL